MKQYKLLIYLFVSASLTLMSCNDFLDTEPDKRIEIKNPNQVLKLLTDGYFSGNYGPICELSSDNLIDNNSPHYDEESKKNVYYNLIAMQKMDDEAFAFEPIKSSTAQDSPSAIWSGCYSAIAVANHALEAIEKMEAEGNVDSKLALAKGEAYLIRAYNHFLLVNVFCQAYKNPELSKSDIGIPYVTKPETKVLVNYERGNVADVYQKIGEDLELGLKNLTTDEHFGKARKFHFNLSAANAFAARYYLFTRNYEKVIDHANLVLGTTPENAKALLMNWLPFKDCTTGDDYSNAWLNPEQANNLMYASTYSLAMRRLSGRTRYACNGSSAAATVARTGPTWSWTILPAVMTTGAFTNGGQEYGLFSGKMMEKFEYTNKTAGIGYPHTIRREFTCSELLLCRAEAKLLSKNPAYYDVDGAVQDLITYEANRQALPDYEQYAKGGDGMWDLTKEIIEKYYREDNSSLKEGILMDYKNTVNMSPDFVIPNEILPYFHCMMDFRRYETLFEGGRFFDLKRFGIEYYHEIGKDANRITLTWNDPRRAIEIPQEVISAGVESSLVQTTPNTKALIKAKSRFVQSK